MADADDFGPGVVGVLAQETARFSMFAQALTSLDMPAGSEVKWIFGHDIPQNMNMLIRGFLSKPDAEWLWIMGDDHCFSPDLLTKLLSHAVDIVVPLCLMRATPYLPVAMSGKVEDGTFAGYRERLALDDHPDGGLVRVHSAGSGGMLVSRETILGMSEPWFWSPEGENLAEDFMFCDKATKEAGAEIWCDLDASLGHMATMAVWPVRTPQGWSFGFSMVGGYQLVAPPGSWPTTAPQMRRVG